MQDLEQETCLPKPIPQKVTSAYFESISEKTDSNCKLFFTYLGTIDIDGNIGYQFIHREYFTVKWTLMERNDGSWIAVSGFLEHQPTTLVETSLEPYDSVISTFKFIE